MFVINGVDYTFHVLAVIFIVISAALFFAGQYALCRRVKRTAVKLIPAYAIVLLIVFAGLVAVSDNKGSLLDLRGAVALIILGYAFVCGVSAAMAWTTYRMRNKK